jgi:hypothetical protein
VGIWVLPLIVFELTRRVCYGLRRSEAHPLRDWQGELIERTPDGGFEVLADSPRAPLPPPAPPIGTAPGQESEL